MIIGVAGRAGSGKDTLADILVRERGFVKVSLADPLKRICREVFDFSDDQLFGPSHSRNAPDTRYPRRDPGEDFSTHLTPRHALQQLGTEWGRACYENVWIDLAIRTAKRIECGQAYTQRQGLLAGGMSMRMGYSPPASWSVVIPDVRFENEAIAIERAGGRVIVLHRDGAGLQGAAGAHASELGIETIGLREGTVHIYNGGTLDGLRIQALALLHTIDREDI